MVLPHEGHSREVRDALKCTFESVGIAIVVLACRGPKVIAEVLLISAQNLFHNVSVDVGQTPLNAVMVESESFVVDTQQVPDRRVPVVGGYRVFDG